MNIYMLLGLAIVATALAVLLKQHRGEYGLAVELAVGVVLLLYVAVNTLPVLETIQSIAGQAAIQTELLAVVLKSLGICYLVQFGADLCRDAGESAIASKLELAGKIVVLTLALPLFNTLLKTVTGLLAR